MPQTPIVCNRNGLPAKSECEEPKGLRIQARTRRNLWEASLVPVLRELVSVGTYYRQSGTVD